jgi:ATP-dependent helicase/nuclease subunit A
VTSRSTPPLDQLSLFSDVAGVDVAEPPKAAPPPADADAQARMFAVDPANNVVLEASAGTGKTSVLVARYINLIKAGVDPSNILAITFTRKAAAEMRERIVSELRAAAGRSELDRARWVELRDRLGEIAISTIDAFCLSLLREFPLEADLDPGFGMADETEVPRLIDEALDRSLRIITGVARTHPDVALVLAQLGISRTREGLAHLLDRRLVAKDALDRFLQRGRPDLTSAGVCGRAVTALHDVLRTVPGGLAGFLADGPARHPRWELFVREVERLPHLEGAPDATLRGVLDRVAAHFLTQEGKPRKSGQIPPYKAADYATPDAAKRHRNAVFQIAPYVENVIKAFNRDLNAILARGVRQMFAIATDQYRAALEERSVLDFSDVLQRAIGLLRQMDEFAQSRFRLEARYHHVLVDEFQDTSRAQWDLVSLLVQSWGEGLGLASEPSIFVVGDRKQSIYRFRDAEVSVLQQAGRYIEGLRTGSSPRQSITRSFRALPELLQFVNDLFEEIAADPPERPDDFSYGDADRFPVDPVPPSHRGPALGIAVSNDPDECARAVAVEIQRILQEDSVRDRQTGVPRQARPGDIAVLFRSRASHREFEQALETRGVPTYVYKGLGFFDADETKDLTALIRYLANPGSNLRAAAFLRSRFIRLSDAGLSLLAPDLAGALDPARPVPSALADDDRRVLECARTHVRAWLAQVDRIPPADLIEQIVRDTAYAFELRGPRRRQAWENVKKMRGLIRRIQNRGYATLMRIGEHIDSLTAGDESNAVIEALDAVNLMTVHAAKGLEFPIVFVVNMAKGASGVPKPVRVMVSGEEEPAVSIGPFVSEMDEAERVREKHESRRLLYVALTRARDRLYFSSALKDGVLAPGRGSLAEVLPPSIATLLARAGSAFPECPAIGWTSSAGRTFEWRICRADADGPEAPAVPETASPRPGLFDRPPVLPLQTRRTVADPGSVPSHERTLGMLTHRLMAASVRIDQARSREERIEYARRLVSDQHAASLQPDALAGIVDAALGAYETLRTRDEIAALFRDAHCVYEVPFSMQDGDAIVRGSIDCLIRRRDGGVVVLEFKTGSARESHRIQLDQYLRAARSMYPDQPVEGQLIYL